MLSKYRRPTHPGEMLREDFLPDYGLTASGLAKSIGVSRRTVTELLNERRGVSIIMALRLSRLFGNSPEFWLNAQRTVDLWDAIRTNRKMISRIIPLKHVQDKLLIDRAAKMLNKEARDVISYQVPIADLGKAYSEMSMNPKREAEALDWLKEITWKRNKRKARLARECAKADTREEKALAEEGMGRCPECPMRLPSGQASRNMKPRQGWARKFRALAKMGDDKLVNSK